MNWYRITLALRSPTGTPWQADTIFGHLCWALRYLRGEAALKEFLDRYRQGQPPLLLSSGFPGDLLPRPLTFRLPEDGRNGVDALSKAKALEKAQKLRKQAFVTHHDFEQALQGQLFEPEPVKDPVKKHVATKNQINRLTSTTGGEGQLFPFVEYWVRRVTVYAKVAQDFQEETLAEMLSLFQHMGYGKRSSVGYGSISGIKLETFQGFSVPVNANAFVTLSPFVPAAGDPTNGYWQTRTKYGKLGEEWATSPNPFKRPILMLTEGSVFFDQSPREWYGRLVVDVSDLPEVVHYGYALPVPLFVLRDS